MPKPKRDDVIEFDTSTLLGRIILVLLIIIIIMLWVKKDFITIKITPKPLQEFICNCNYKVPICEPKFAVGGSVPLNNITFINGTI